MATRLKGYSNLLGSFLTISLPYAVPARMLALFLFCPLAFAGNDALNCQMILHETATQTPKKTDTGYSMKISRRNGIANCTDGRLLQIQMMLSELQNSKQNLITGFGVLAFEKGGAVTVRIRGTEKSFDENETDTAASASLNFEIITGSGAYQNSQGSGAVQLVEGSWSDARVFSLTLVIQQK